MIDHDTRVAILRLAQQGHSTRKIALAVDVSRESVQRVISRGVAHVPPIERPSRLDAHRERIRELYDRVKGNLVRVHEELSAVGVAVPYSTLTEFCRREDISAKRRQPAGEYDFPAALESQHDTSPHGVILAGRRHLMQCASLVLCYSRMIFAQVYPTYDRFTAKIFLTDALTYLGGATQRVVIDNTSVILARGSGKDAVVAPEMEAFAKRFGFCFLAHAPGHANRSARVERPFAFIENNFYPGREFADRHDLNQQLIAWCDRVNERYRRHLRSRPVDLFPVERPLLVPLPLHVPAVYRLHTRNVDASAYVHLDTNRYSVPGELTSHEVQVRETKDKVRIFRGPRLICEHPRLEPKAYAKSKLPEHQHPRARKERGNPKELSEAKALRLAGPELDDMVTALHHKHGGRAARAVKQLYRLYLDYPEQHLRAAVAEALTYGMLDVKRLERMILRRVGEEVFRLWPDSQRGRDGSQEKEDSHE